MNSSPSDIFFIDDETKCGEILQLGLDVGCVGVDIESNSMHVYYEKLALLQISINDQVFLIDVPKIGLPDPLKDLLTSTEIIKVFQDMKFDIQILKQEYDVVVAPVFDISIGDKILRESTQSYNMEKLVDRYLQKRVKYSKRQQKSNWGNRPLSDKQITYAAADVIFLVPIMNIIETDLKMDFSFEFFELFMKYVKPEIRTRYYNQNYVYKLLKNFEIKDVRIASRMFHLLNSLDINASEVDRPSHWLLSDNNIVTIATRNPQTQVEFNKFFHRKDGLQSEREVIQDSLFSSLLSKDLIQLQLTEEISTRRWLYYQETNQSSEGSKQSSIELIRSIREWRTIVAQNLRLIPELILDKKDFHKIANNLNEVKSVVIFPGVPKRFHQLFWDDLMRFIKSGESKISRKIIETT